MSSYHASAPVPTKPLGSARTLVRAGFTPLTENEQPFTHAPAGRRSQTRVILVVRDQRNREPLFLTSKVRLHCDAGIFMRGTTIWNLFLTSKVRLHCDLLMASLFREHYANLFLTSKVRLHCDHGGTTPPVERAGGLFLTSKVRLHCDILKGCPSPHPMICLFLTSKVRLHCDSEQLKEFGETLINLFLTSKVRLHCDNALRRSIPARTLPFPDLKGQAPLRQPGDVAGPPAVVVLFLTSKVRLHCDKV